MVTIANDFLTVNISRHGAELTSIKDNLTGRERLWQADPEVWPRHAPVLFPIVGALADQQYHYAGKTYHMGQHGFARDAQTNRDHPIEKHSEKLKKLKIFI